MLGFKTLVHPPVPSQQPFGPELFVRVSPGFSFRPVESMNKDDLNRHRWRSLRFIQNLKSVRELVLIIVGSEWWRCSYGCKWPWFERLQEAANAAETYLLRMSQLGVAFLPCLGGNGYLKVRMLAGFHGSILSDYSFNTGNLLIAVRFPVPRCAE
jgi:hypothetical protein